MLGPKISLCEKTDVSQQEHQNGVENQKKRWIVTAVHTAQQRIPILRWIQTYNRVDAISDFIAGVTLGLTLIPQSIAYAALAGVPPQYGLNSAFVGCFVYVVFGTIKEVFIGPTSLMSLLTYQYTSQLTPDFVVALCFFVGCIEFLMGVFKLGFLVDFISIPVTSGFQTATSIIIIISQLKGILGVRFKSCGILDNVYQLTLHFKESNFSGDFALGVGCIVFLLTMRKLKDIPMSEDTPIKRLLKQTIWFLSTARNFIAVVISAMISYYFENYTNHVPFQLSGHVQPGLPPFAFPNLTPTIGNHTYTTQEVVENLGAGIFIIPTIAVLANVAIAKAFVSGATIDATQEMLTLSLCNVLGSFVQAMPTCGAFTRSAVASASGVRTPFAGFYSGLMSMLALTFLTPYFHLIPRATLSAVLISAVMFLIDYQIILPLWRSNKQELCIILVTLISCLGLGVEIGLFLGVILSTFHLIYLWARPHVTVKVRNVHHEQGVYEYIVVTPMIGMFFPAVDMVSNKLSETALKQGGGTLPIVLDCSHFTSLDTTAIKGFISLLKDFKKREQQFIFLNISAKMIRRFDSFGSSNIQICSSELELEDMLFGNKPLGNRNPLPIEHANGPSKENSNIQEAIPLMERNQLDRQGEQKQTLHV